MPHNKNIVFSIVFYTTFTIVLLGFLTIFGALLMALFAVATSDPAEIGSTLNQIFGPLLSNLK